MALSPTNNNATFVQEVDEAVRKDRMDSIMQRWGRWIAGAMLVALAAFGGYLYWDHRQTEARGEQAEALLAAFEKAGASQPAAAAEALAKLETSSPAYGAAALTEQANLKAQSGALKGAAALMAKVVADTKLDPALRDMALVRQTAFEFDTLKPETVIARMKPMVDAKEPASAWFASAAELSAIAHYRLGQFDQAGSLYGRIAKLPDVSKSLQSRSVQMAGMLGVDAVTDRASESAAQDQKGSAAPGAAAAEKIEEAK